MKTLELLAPARNAEIGIAAIRCGADAVYIGGPSFGARAAAGNSTEDILRLCDFAARFGARIFITVNTLAADDRERREIVDMMLGLKDKGVSAFIIQDCTLLPLLAEHGPWKEEFHASTQCAVRTPERALELAGMGFSRIILERELSLERICEIRAALPEETELEFFVHGALCVCYSGDCYLSEYLTGRSANRGECAQPCRNRYDLVDKDGTVIVRDKPLLSLKDLQLIERIPELAEAGIVSFKIEGRLKNESYVKNVVRAYSIALDKLVAEQPDKYLRASYGKVEGGFTPNLDKTFNRGYTQLFIDGRKGNWNSGDSAKGMGEIIGTVARTGESRTYESRTGRKAQPDANGRAWFSLDRNSDVRNGDGLCYVDRHGDVVGLRAEVVENGRIFCKSTEGLYPGATVWRNLDTAFEKELENNLPERVIDVTLDMEFDGGILTARCLGHELKADVSSFPIAENQDRMSALIRSQMSKRAGIFRFSTGAVVSEGNLPLLSASFLNTIRRSMADILAQDSRPGSLCGTCASFRETDSTEGHGPLCQADGLDLTHPHRKGELMRTKYCILAETGKCLKTEKGREFARAHMEGNRGLYLLNNGKKIALLFDCRACEMVLVTNSVS